MWKCFQSKGNSHCCAWKTGWGWVSLKVWPSDRLLEGSKFLHTVKSPREIAPNFLRETVRAESKKKRDELRLFGCHLLSKDFKAINGEREQAVCLS